MKTARVMRSIVSQPIEKALISGSACVRPPLLRHTGHPASHKHKATRGTLRKASLAAQNISSEIIGYTGLDTPTFSRGRWFTRQKNRSRSFSRFATRGRILDLSIHGFDS